MKTIENKVARFIQEKQLITNNIKTVYVATSGGADSMALLAFLKNNTEYNIVALLAAHAGKVMTYAEIIKEIWKWSDAGSIKKLQVNMANIRKKMGIKPGDNQYIINELGVGYRMNVDIDG